MPLTAEMLNPENAEHPTLKKALERRIMAHNLRQMNKDGFGVEIIPLEDIKITMQTGIVALQEYKQLISKKD